MNSTELNSDLNNFFQEYFVKPQLINSGTDDEDQRKEGLKAAIQKCFVQHLLGYDNLKSFLESSENASKIFEAISSRDSQDTAKEVFENAISEAKEIIASEFGMAPRRKKEHELLAEELDKRYENGKIVANIDRVIAKNGSSTIGDSCEGGGCGC